MRALVALSVIALCACGLSSRPTDGGSGGGTSGTGGGMGGAGGGEALISLVPLTLADAGPFTFQDISPPHGTLAPDWEKVSGTSNTRVIVTSSYGEIQQFDGQAWTTLFVTSPVSRFEGLYAAPSGALFSVDEENLRWCLSDCAVAASWTEQMKTGVSFHGMCGKDEIAYAVGSARSTNAGVVYKYLGRSADAWGELSGAVFANEYSACAVGADGTLYLAGNRYVVEVSATSARKVDLVPGGSIVGLMQWNTALAVGDDIILGGFSKRLARRSPGGQWTLQVQMPNFDSTGWFALAPGVPGEVLVGGAWTGLVGGFARLEAAGLTVYCEPRFSVTGMWAADPNTVFLVGYDEPSGVSHVYRATR